MAKRVSQARSSILRCYNKIELKKGLPFNFENKGLPLGRAALRHKAGRFSLEFQEIFLVQAASLESLSEAMGLRASGRRKTLEPS